MEPYTFDPLNFGFLAPKQMPKQIKDRYGNTTFCKVICTTEDGSFWYLCCYQMPHQDRWKFIGGLHDANNPLNQPTHDEYMGCITSEDYAKALLTHLLGTTTNEGTLKYGPERLVAPSQPIPKRKPKQRIN